MEDSSGQKETETLNKKGRKYIMVDNRICHIKSIKNIQQITVCHCSNNPSEDNL